MILESGKISSNPAPVRCYLSLSAITNSCAVPSIPSHHTRVSGTFHAGLQQLCALDCGLRAE
eukprot:COSAG05_NODE_647_length_8113_cov_15.485900_7_plen_62_part_00